MLNRWSKQAITNFFSFPGKCCTQEWNVCISWTRESQLIFRRTQLNVKLSNATFYTGENTQWRILSVLMSLFAPFQIPKTKWLRELKQATSTKAHFYTDVFMLAVSAVFCLTDLNNSIPNGSLIVTKGKRRKNANVSLRNVKK